MTIGWGIRDHHQACHQRGAAWEESESTYILQIASGRHSYLEWGASKAGSGMERTTILVVRLKDHTRFHPGAGCMKTQLRSVTMVSWDITRTIPPYNGQRRSSTCSVGESRLQGWRAPWRRQTTLCDQARRLPTEEGTGSGEWFNLDGTWLNKTGDDRTPVVALKDPASWPTLISRKTNGNQAAER
jgi:hypothetical protein